MAKKLNPLLADRRGKAMSEMIIVTHKNLAEVARKAGVTVEVLKEDYEKALAKNEMLVVYIR